MDISVSLDEDAWEFLINGTTDYPSPKPRPNLLSRLQTPGSAASFHPHTRSRGPITDNVVQTPPDIRKARWRRIDRKISQQRRRSELFTRNRANSDTSLLYRLGTGDEDLSFGELRNFNDSYALDEPEPELGPEILNFIGVPIIDPIIDMAGEGQNLEGIAIVNPPLVPEAEGPGPGAMNVVGGENNDPPPPPRVPPGIKLDPTLPGVNLNITVAEWINLQNQYNAEHAQRDDEDDDEDDDDEQEQNRIRIQAEMHQNRRDDDNRSTDSADTGGGLHRVVTHISKPVGVLLDPETRDDPIRIERSKQHLNRLTPAYITNALSKDNIIVQQTNDIRDMQESLKDLALQMRQVLSGQHRSQNSLLEKTGRIRPNPLSTYPHSDNKAPESVYQAAVGALSQKMKTVEKSIQFVDSPYEYLLEVAALSNVSASTYGLTREQQRFLILNFVPPTSFIYKELGSMNLEDIFYLASTNSVAILTPAELDKKLEEWQLDVSSLQKLNESLGQLKATSIEVLRMPIEKVCHKTLFLGMVKRIKREKSLHPATIRKLDEAMFEIERETNPVELHKLLLAPLKEVVGYQARRGSWSKPYQVHAFETAVATIDAKMTHAQPQTNNGGTKPKQKKQNKKPGQDSNPNKQNQNKQGQKGQDRGRSKSRDRDGPKNRDRSQSRDGRPFTSVAPWPANKPYMNTQGNGLMKEMQDHFAGHCFKCGHSSHRANKCRIYPSRTPVLTLCQTCCAGFHDQCKSWRRKAIEGDGTVNRVSKLEDMMCKYGQMQPYPPPFPFPYPYPYPPQQVSTRVVTGIEEED